MLVLTGGLFGGVFGMQWFGKQKMNEFLDNMPEPAATISTARAQEMVWDNRLTAVGSLVAVNGANITTEVDGTVTGIHFASGDQVERGAPLISLNSAIERAELKRLQAQATLAELNRARQQKLFERGTLSQAEYDSAVAQTDAAKAAVQAQQGRVAQKNIVAPFAGRLGVRRVTVGQHLDVGTVIVTLQSLDPIDVDFSLPERHLGTVRSGLPVSVTVDAYPGRQFTGEVAAVEPTVDPGTRNFTLRARLPNPDHKLHPGQSANVRLTLPGERRLVVIPRTAVNYSSYGTSVFVVREGAAETPERNEARGEVVQRFIETGEARGDFVAVTKGLEEGEEIATSGLLKLRNGQPVVVNNDVTPQAELEPEPAES